MDIKEMLETSPLNIKFLDALDSDLCLKYCKLAKSQGREMFEKYIRILHDKGWLDCVLDYIMGDAERYTCLPVMNRKQADKVLRDSGEYACEYRTNYWWRDESLAWACLDSYFSNVNISSNKELKDLAEFLDKSAIVIDVNGRWFTRYCRYAYIADRKFLHKEDEKRFLSVYYWQPAISPHSYTLSSKIKILLSKKYLSQNYLNLLIKYDNTWEYEYNKLFVYKRLNKRDLDAMFNNLSDLCKFISGCLSDSPYYVLYEDKGVIYLKSSTKGESYYTYVDGKVFYYVWSGRPDEYVEYNKKGLSENYLERCKACIEKAVGYLQSKVSYPVKSIRFSINRENLKRGQGFREGYIGNSEEKGSYNMYLEI